jgi:RNA-directed DNA polymerase
MNEIQTLGVKSIKHLCAVLMTTPKELEELIKHREKYYYTKKKEKPDKRGGAKRDENGDIVYRELNPSTGRLKEIQQIIRHRILLKILLPPNIKGAVKGSNNIANGRAHLGKKFKFKTDMKKYYPSITPDVVYQLFRDHGFSNKCCSILTHLTTYKHELPQGTPTGPDIANRIFLPQDKKIIRYCLKYGITYTRYIDDLVFSCREDFRAHCLPLIDFILEAGFKISIEKTIYRAGKMEITGVTVKNNVLDVSDYFKTLMGDETIPKHITQGRKAYYKQVRKKLVKR